MSEKESHYFPSDILSVDALSAALQKKLPAEYHDYAPQLARLLIETAIKHYSSNEHQGEDEVDKALLPVLGKLKGKEVRSDGATLSFGNDNQFGDVSIHTAVGRDQYHIRISLSVPKEYRQVRPQKRINERRIVVKIFGVTLFSFTDTTTTTIVRALIMTALAGLLAALLGFVVYTVISRPLPNDLEPTTLPQSPIPSVTVPVTPAEALSSTQIAGTQVAANRAATAQAARTIIAATQIAATQNAATLTSIANQGTFATIDALSTLQAEGNQAATQGALAATAEAVSTQAAAGEQAATQGALAATMAVISTQAAAAELAATQAAIPTPFELPDIP